MKTISLLWFFYVFFASVLSTITSPLFDINGDIITYQRHYILQLPEIENILGSRNLRQAPENYKPFLEWLFTQPNFSFSDFSRLVDDNIVPLDIAHVAFSKFASVLIDNHQFLFLSKRFGQVVMNFFNNFNGFHQEFVQICDILGKRLLNDDYVDDLLYLVEERQDDFKLCLTEDLFVFLIDNRSELDRSFVFCYASMMDADWFNLNYLAQMLHRFEGDISPVLIEKTKTILVDLEAASCFVHNIEEFFDEIQDLLLWIVSQSWATSELIVDMIKHFDVSENTIDLKLICHEKASFSCVAALDLDDHILYHPLMQNAFERIVEIIKRDCSKKQFYTYIASIAMDYEEIRNTKTTIIKMLMEALPERFLPTHAFFRNLMEAYPAIEEGDFRKPMMLLLYLDAFGTKMSQVDLDYILNLAFASRPYILRDQTKIWTEIAEKILRISFTHGQSLVHLAKTDGPSPFSSVNDITSYISVLAVNSIDNLIADLKQAHLTPELYVQKLPELGKYEKTFLMLTDPNISKLFSAALKSLDQRCLFMTNARKLNLAHVARVKSRSLQLLELNQNVWDGFRNKTLENSHDWENLMDLLQALFNSDDYVAEQDIISDIAQMILEYPLLEKIPLKSTDIYFLRHVLASKLKRQRPEDHDEESDPKRQRRF